MKEDFKSIPRNQESLNLDLIREKIKIRSGEKFSGDENRDLAKF